MSNSGIKYKLKVHFHDGASIVSAEHSIAYQQPISADYMEQAVSKTVEKLQRQIQALKGYIGHIKVFVDCDDACLWISSTGNRQTSKHNKKWEDAEITIFNFYLTAIVFNLNPGDLEDQVVKVLDDFDDLIIMLSSKGE